VRSARRAAAHLQELRRPAARVRLAGFTLLGPWFKRFPGAPTDTVPVEIIATPGGKVRCVRAGSLADADYAVVRTLLAR
jgi:hypothetical protein